MGDTSKLCTRVDKSGACWLWTGDRFASGYGRIKIKGKGRLAHRIMYETYVGPVPDGLVLDHLCEVKECVNPAHLEAVTQQENTRRGSSPVGLNARKTHCPRGHEYDEANTRITPSGRRDCRACRRKGGRHG